jgi:hypothetical protein
MGDFVLELRWNVKLVDRRPGIHVRAEENSGKAKRTRGSRHPHALLIGSNLDLTCITWLFDV